MAPIAARQSGLLFVAADVRITYDKEKPKAGGTQFQVK